MTQKRFSAKIVLSIVAALLIMGTLCTVAFAANQVANYKCAYGQAVPTDDKLSAKISQYTFTGDEGTLYFMQISKGKPNAHYAVEIFSDSGYKTKIRSFSKEFSETAGNTPLKIKWEFKNTGSGTYYGRCYTYVETTKDGVVTKTVDTSSFSTFKININRMSSKTVKLKTLANSATGPKLTWETLPTATKYNVYRKAAGDKSWTYLTTLAGAASSYVDTKAVSGKDYTYTVKCGDGKYTSKYDTKGLTIKYLSMPRISVVGTGTAGNALVRWGEVAGAQGYYVYRKGGNLSDYNWKLIATIKNGKTVSYTDKAATSTDWNYTYTVKAYNGKTVSAYNYNGVDFDYIKAPTLKRVSSYDGGMKIEWTNNNENVTKFYVYRLKNGDWQRLGDTTASFFIDKTAVPNATHTYTVMASSDTNVGGFNAKGITAKYIKTPALKSLAFDSNYNAVLKWEAIEGASGYAVYRKIDNAKSWSPLRTIKDGKTTQFIDNSKKIPGASYKYTVRAFDKDGIYSYFKENGIVCVHLTKPDFKIEQIETADNSLALSITWDKVVGAPKYNLYKRDAGTKSWAESHYIKTITDTSYIDTNVVNGKTYEYAVKAYIDKYNVSPYYTRSATAITIPGIIDVSVVAEPSPATNIIWNEVDGADSYNVYRVAKNGAEWEKITNTTETMFIDDSEGASTTAYYYAVSTVIGKLESAKSAPVGNFAEVTLEATATDDGIKLDWACDKYSKATITRATGTEEAVPVGGFTDGRLSCTDSSAEKGSTYTYTINITVDGKVNGEASVTIRRPHDPLAATVITSVNNATEGNLYAARINWLQVDFAEQYIVLRASDDGFLNWTEIGTLTNEDAINGELSFVDNTVSQDTEYAYKIKATAPVSNRPESESEYKTIILLSPLDPIFNVTATHVEGDLSKVKVTWAPVENAEGYRIYRTNSPAIEESWEQIGEKIRTVTEIIDDTFTSSGEYYYKIVAWSTERGQVSRIYPEATEKGVIVKLPLKAAVVTVSNATTSVYAVEVKWTAVNESEQYDIYKSSDNGNTWETIANLTNAAADEENSISYIDTAVVPGVEYIYKVKATAPIDNLPESESEAVTIKLDECLLDFTKAEATVGEDNKSVIVSWSSVKGAEKYIIYYTATPEDESSWKQSGVYKSSSADRKSVV